MNFVSENSVWDNLIFLDGDCFFISLFFYGVVFLYFFGRSFGGFCFFGSGSFRNVFIFRIFSSGVYSGFFYCDIVFYRRKDFLICCGKI